MKVTRIYVGEPDRYYPELAVTPNKGDKVTFDSADQVPDDGRWQAPTAKTAKKTAAPKPRSVKQKTVTLPQTPPQPDSDASAPASTEE